MIRTFLLSILFISAVNIDAQDRDAKKILDEISEKYEAYKSMEIFFDLKVDYPERPAEVQKASIVQQGKSFVFKSQDQDIYGNGDDVWYYLKDRNEVQINDFEEDDDLGMMTPKDLLRQYKSDKFEYAITHAEGDDVYIEFKPLDRYSDYSKYRIKVSKKKKDFTAMEAFGKDGSKLYVTISSFIPNKRYASDYFAFNAQKHPGVVVEDLRLD
jgi:outer membrane lipoprotein carrier protein